MPYVPLDDHFHSHRKVLAAGLEAVGVHARSLSWVGANLTDGHIPASADTMICGSTSKAKRLRDLLLNVGLRDKCAQHNDCTVIHDWGSINDPGDELKAAREKERDRKRKWRSDRRTSQDEDGTRDGTGA
jgi:hypothetical protein